MGTWHGGDYMVVDVEGNGGRPPDLVELAIVPVRQGLIGEPACWLVRPDQPITGHAARLHGITNAQLTDAPTFTTIQPEIVTLLTRVPLVAHNAHVDAGLLARKLGHTPWSHVVDTLKLARRHLPGRDSYRLGHLADTLDLAGDLPTGLTPHRATYDALVTARLLLHLTEPDTPTLL